MEETTQSALQRESINVRRAIVIWRSVALLSLQPLPLLLWWCDASRERERS